MGRVVALGESALVDGFALGGATVARAGDPTSVRRAWASLYDDVDLLILTARAAGALGDLDHGSALVVVIPA